MLRSTLIFSCVLGLLVTSAQQGSAQAIDLASAELVDLTHSYSAKTLYWPTPPGGQFELKEISYGPTPQGYFYSAYSLSTPEHGGTHLDAPIHFAEKGVTADKIPLTRLVAPAVVIDVSAQAARNRDYQLTVADIQAFEAKHGKIAPGTIVLLRTDWSRHWPNAKEYLGDDKQGSAAKLSFPAYGNESARFLVEQRKVAALGVDTASIDYGRSTDFMVHRIALGANVPGFENLTNLARLPPTGALVIALPMKIENGSGGPLRAIAVVPRKHP